MADKIIVTKSKVTSLFDKIRAKAEVTGTHTFEEMETVVDGIQGEDLMQKKIDTTKSCYYLFSHMPGANLDDYTSLDTSQVTDMSYMFDYCEELTTIPAFDTSNVENMQYLFNCCEALVSVPNLNTPNVTNMYNMFRNCSALTTPPQMDTSKVTRMNYMFSGCTALETIPEYDTSSATDMSYMFEDCENLLSIPELNTENVTNMSNMFYGCHKLAELPALDTNNVTRMSYMFYQCYDLETIDISCFNISSTSYSSYMFYFCKSLKTLIIRDFGTNALNSNAFSGCCHMNGTVDATYNPNGDRDGLIYVPDDMVDTVKADSDWSNYVDQIRPLSELDGGGEASGYTVNFVQSGMYGEGGEYSVDGGNTWYSLGQNETASPRTIENVTEVLLKITSNYWQAYWEDENGNKIIEDTGSMSDAININKDTTFYFYHAD